jgi:uncharacterized protein YndB with AHSA1/START domain
MATLRHGVRSLALPKYHLLDFWFRPRCFESEGLYIRMGALVLKHYVPTGGDLIMRRIRRVRPRFRLVNSSVDSLCRYERRTRLSELVHLIGFIGGAILITLRFVSGSLTALTLTLAFALNVMFGLWPIVLQRYNRVRLYRAINRHSVVYLTEEQDKEKKLSNHEQYTPGPAYGAQVNKELVQREGVEKDIDKWTLILVRELQHSPERVWQALTDPAQMREWAPFDTDGNLGKIGTVKLTWVGTPTPIETKVTRAEAPKVLEYGDNRWELEPFGGGTRLTLWSNIDRRYIAWGAAGWHIAFDVLDRLLSGTPIARIAGGDAMKFEGWQRLSAEYAKQFGAEPPKG